jgi:hypothetical protein
MKLNWNQPEQCWTRAFVFDLDFPQCQRNSLHWRHKNGGHVFSPQIRGEWWGIAILRIAANTISLEMASPESAWSSPLSPHDHPHVQLDKSWNGTTVWLNLHHCTQSLATFKKPGKKRRTQSALLQITTYQSSWLWSGFSGISQSSITTHNDPMYALRLCPRVYAAYPIRSI